MNESNEIEFEYVLSNGKTFEAKIKEDSGFIYNKYNKDIINRFFDVRRKFNEMIAH